MKTYNIKAICELLEMKEVTFKKKVVKFGMTEDKLKGTQFKYTDAFLKKFKNELAKQGKS